MIWNFIFGAAALLFLAMVWNGLWHLRWVHRLPPLRDDESSPPAGTPLPRCSVVLAARDEEARLGQTLHHLLAQTGVDLEVIVVDDRSTDGTGRIAGELAAADTRVRLIRIDTLPEGWLGKCHACLQGAQLATGDWILFTDADCWLKPDVMARALRVAADTRADHVTLTPGVNPESAFAGAWHIAFLLSVADWISGVNRDRRGRHLGVGAFNLMKADAYRACGGHEALRLTVLDDVRLGLLLHRAGKRTRAFIGGDDVECHWGRTVSSMIRLMEKNYFAALDYRVVPALAVGIGAPLLWLIALGGLVSGNVVGAAAGVTLVLLVTPAAILARRLGWGFGPALLTPFAYPALFYAVLNSTLVTLRQGGIRWRDTFYPLEQLRRGNLR